MKKRNLMVMVLVGSMFTGMLTGCGRIQSELLTPAESISKDLEKTESGQAEAVTDDTALWNFTYRMLQENLEDTNPVLSPVSAYLAMGMVGLGAQGDTLTEFENVMGKDMHAVSGALMQNIPTWLQDTSDDKEKSVLSVENSVWVDETMNPDETWLQDVSEIYKAEAYRSVLSSTATMKDINNWVEAKTNSLIKGFLNKPLAEDVKMALFNTVYFNGKWRSEFKAKNTKKEDFTTTDGAVVKVDMMYASRNEIYVKNDVMDGVIMDYRYGNMAFVALKPTADQTVREMYEQLTYKELTELLDSAENRKVKLKFPKFEVEFDKALNETLQNMGIQKAFEEEQADFTGLGYTTDGYPLYIGLVRQKAVIKVDEEGTEAAAVTVVEAVATSAEAPQTPIEVYFDEPFLYMIIDMESRTPLFIGVMDNPAE